MAYPKLVPEAAAKFPAVVEIEQEGLDDTGEPLGTITVNAKCNYQERTEKVYSNGKVDIVLRAKCYFDGDICTSVNTISGGYVTILGERRRIKAGTKAYNPDGTVNYTCIELE